MSKFVLRRVASGIKFDLTAANGQVILSSETYISRAAALKGIMSVRRSAAMAGLENHTEENRTPAANPRFELFQDRAGEYRFRLKARNGKIIGTSEGYSTKAGCLNGIDSVRSNAPEAEIEK